MTTRITLSNELSELAGLAAQVDGFAALHDLPPDVLMALQLSLEEVVTNVIAYAFDGGRHPIEVELSLEDGAVLASVIDGGREYNPLLRPEPDVDAPLEERQVGGLGILLVKRLMDDVAYRRASGKNILAMRKRR